MRVKKENERNTLKKKKNERKICGWLNNNNNFPDFKAN